MPRYDWRCDECRIEWEETRRIAQASDPCACPQCGDEDKTYQHIGAPGMIRVEGGNSPTRVRHGYTTQRKVDDKGFNNEFQSIFADDPITNPVTGEEYEYTEDPETGRHWASLPSNADGFAYDDAAARKMGVPTRHEQHEARGEWIDKMASPEFKKVRRDAAAKIMDSPNRDKLIHEQTAEEKRLSDRRRMDLKADAYAKGDPKSPEAIEFWKTYKKPTKGDPKW